MNVYRTNEGPYTAKDFEIEIPFDHAKINSINSYRHCNLPIMGVGPKGPENSFLCFDQHLDLSDLDQINHEIKMGESLNKVKFNKILANGIVPTEVNGQKCIDSYLANLDKYQHDSVWKKDTDLLTRKGDIKTYFHNYFNIPMPWDGIAMFREYTASYQEKSNPSKWLSLIDSFPTLKNFVDRLPFDYVGYVMVFKSVPNKPVLIHRDFYPTNHNVNFINFRLSTASRPFFLYDFITKSKKYLPADSKSYFFNEIDAHGLDAETASHYTLRVEGRFKKDFRNLIGLNENDVFNWDYSHCKNFLDSGQFIIEQNTDL